MHPCGGVGAQRADWGSGSRTGGRHMPKRFCRASRALWRWTMSVDRRQAPAEGGRVAQRDSDHCHPRSEKGGWEYMHKPPQILRGFHFLLDKECPCRMFSTDFSACFETSFFAVAVRLLLDALVVSALWRSKTDIHANKDFWQALEHVIYVSSP